MPKPAAKPAAFRGLVAVLALSALALPVCARAQTLLDRANAAATAGPDVLLADPDNHGLLPPGYPGAERAIPIPHVMNGGGFGYSGFDYDSDATTPTRLGRRRQVNRFILAPAPKAPLR